MGESRDNGSAAGTARREVRQLMGILQVPELVRRAPLLVLRAVFTGIGRVLMIADRPPPAAAPARSNGVAPRTTPGVADATETETPVGAETPVGPEAAVETENAAAAGTQGAVGLPLPNYDTLSLASIRARLRGLGVAQLKVLLDYEATHAERGEVLGMFERRIEKLEAGA